MRAATTMVGLAICVLAGAWLALNCEPAAQPAPKMPDGWTEIVVPSDFDAGHP